MKYEHLPKDIRMVAIDLDDTLLRKDLTISEENQRALLAAEEAGVSVVLASGRVKEAMWRYGTQLGMVGHEGYMISSNGCLVLRTDTEEVLIRHTLEVDKALEVYEYSQKVDTPLIVYHEGEIVTDRVNSWVEKDSGLSGLPIRIVEDFPSFLRENPPLKVLMQNEEKIIQNMLPEVRERWSNDFNITLSKPYFLEFLPINADKGHALRHLSELLGISSDQIMAIGDAHNDLGMIRFAGIGVAVGNAVQEVKEAADVVLDTTHEDHAVADAVHTFILKDRDCC